MAALLISIMNRQKAMELLDKWFSEPDDLGPEFWAEWDRLLGVKKMNPKIKACVSLLFAILVLLMVFFLLWYGWHQNIQSTRKDYLQGYRDGYNYIKSPSELQLLIGAKEDGYIGPETIKKWERACGDQFAAEFVTPSGAPAHPELFELREEVQNGARNEH